MAGRIGSKKIVITQENQKTADDWLVYIGSVYDEYKRLFSKYNYTEDNLNQTIILCYEAIQRNGLKDTTPQGMKNYLFRAYNMNTIAFKNNPFDSRRIDMPADDIKQLIENNTDETAEEKYNRQTYNDFAVIYLLKVVEDNFDILTYWCWRVKYLVPKTSFEKLKCITKLKDCKSRVHRVNAWLKLNVDEQSIKDEYNKLTRF